MSAQTDCEMLSIEVMEAYAGKYNLSGNKVVELFQKNQVFEKMLIQHEYLHQVSFEEVMEFVENVIADASKELVVYHGTCSEFEKINLNKSHNRRDFGKGFYTTILQSQSKEWAYRLSLREKQNDYYVYEFLFEEVPALKVKRFDRLNDEWLEFIKKNRSKGGLQHDYDVVISTVMLANEQRLIMVHPILTDQDRVAILRNCMATEPQAKMQIDDILKIASNYINPDQLNDFHKNLQDYYSSIQVQKVPHKTYDRGLLDFLKGSHIQCVESKVSWEEAIHISAQPLLDDGSISNDYVNAIINDQKNKGLYMFLADDLVLAHSAIENGVNRLDVSMCTFKEPVPFLNGQSARIILVLCAEDKTKHIHVLNDMLNIFSKKKSIDQIASLNSPAEIYSYIDKHIEK